ncbi:MAG: Flp pilus assembly protein CpaB [Alphaproteobacteria bacterium]
MESKAKLIVLSVAGVVVAFGAISVYNAVVGTQEVAIVEKEEAKNFALLAKRDLSAGSFVQVPQDVDWAEVPPNSTTDAHIREGTVQLGAFNGAVVRRQLRAGDLVTQDALMTSREGGFMSAVLENGFRAISVAVNPTSGNAGFISPGDRVDMIVTRKVRNSNSSGGNDEQIVSETFIEDVRVLAVDQQLDNPENKAILAKTVTVQVSPEQAEKVAVATELGKISLVLRSAAMDIKKQEDAQNTGAEPVDMIDAVVGASSQEDTQSQERGTMAPRIRVIRGDVVENIEMR